MPNLANAKKALRQSIKRAGRNKMVLDEIASLRRHLRVALKDKKLDEAKKLTLTLTKKMDKAAGRKILKKNTVARLKSRMMKSIAKVAA